MVVLNFTVQNVKSYNKVDLFLKETYKIEFLNGQY